MILNSRAAFRLTYLHEDAEYTLLSIDHLHSKLTSHGLESESHVLE